ncbi:Uncharacterised protein [uncultured archaeon]|nr:Uncharacterised protein [uncultured archaeon]
MVKALVEISDDANKMLMIVKAEYGLKDKSQAIDKMAEDYRELVFKPRVKASYLKRLDKIQKGRTIKVGGVEDFDRRYGLKK